MKYFKTIILEHPLQFEQLKSFLKPHLGTTWKRKRCFFVDYAVNQRLSLSERKCLSLSERYRGLVMYVRKTIGFTNNLQVIE
jgi:hypothetical protein